MEPAISINRPSSCDRITAFPMPSILKLRKQEYEIQSGMTVRDAMIRNDIDPEIVIPTRDGELIADDEVIRDGETIRLVPVISGGYAQRAP
jgi:sulfur carrier protein